MNELTDYTTPLTDPTRWQRFAFRSGDIVISTPPKCGTTWTQMLSALLVFDDVDLPGPLDALSPWLDTRLHTEADITARIEAQTHRRFVKTHTPLDGLPERDDVTYVTVGRDPRDAMVSFEHHMANIDFDKVAANFAAQGRLAELEATPPPAPPDPDPAIRFRVFIDDDGMQNEAPTLRSVLRHVDSAWQRRHRPNVGLFHYADLQADLVGEMGRLADLLGINVSQSRLVELAAAASLDRMRSRAEYLAPETVASLWLDTAGFFRSGGSGEWAERGTPADHEHYDERVDQLADPDLARWVHAGRRASGVDATV